MLVTGRGASGFTKSFVPALPALGYDDAGMALRQLCDDRIIFPNVSQPVDFTNIAESEFGFL